MVLLSECIFLIDGVGISKVDICIYFEELDIDDIYEVIDMIDE